MSPRPADLPLPNPYHDRDTPFVEACLELSGFLLDWRKRHHVTPSELFAALSDEIRKAAGYCIRHERGEE